MLAVGKALTAEQRLKRVSTEIIGREEFTPLVGVFMVGTKAIKDDVPTACTNGRDEMYGREFVENLSDAEFRFLMLHECFHKMYKHLTTWQALYKENKRLANMACDYVINIKLTDTEAYRMGWLKMPEGGLLDEQYRGKNAKQVYDLLKQDGEDGDGGDGFDSHDWEGAEELSQEEIEALAKEIDEAVRQGAVLAGKTKKGDMRDLQDLLETKQDWRELFRDFVMTTCSGKDISTWRRVNRRYIGMDVLMAGTISESVGDIVIGIDTSGSIGAPELARFMGEVKGICEQVSPSRVHVMYWDTEVCKHEVYLQHELDGLIQRTEVKGGGGTDASAVARYLAEKEIKAECVVQFTDGYIGSNWGTWSVPTLWCINGNKGACSPVGKTIHIED